MKDYIIQRVLDMADYIINTGCTLRFAAKIFAVSKSTAHKDMSERLYYIDKKKFEQVKQKTQLNLKTRNYVRMSNGNFLSRYLFGAGSRIYGPQLFLRTMANYTAIEDWCKSIKREPHTPAG